MFGIVEFRQTATWLLAMLMLFTQSVSAEVFDAGEASVALVGEISAVGKFVIYFFMIVGIIFVGLGLKKLRASQEDPRSNPVGGSLVMILCGGALSTVLGIMTFSPDSLGLGG